MCLDTCFHTGALFHLLGLSSVIGNLFSFLYYCLIAASSKRQLNGNAGKLIILDIAAASHTDTDA